MKISVLDSCALIALIRNEEGADFVNHVLKNSVSDNKTIIIHMVTVAEVYYDIFRTSGKDSAEELFIFLYRLPVTIIYKINEDFIRHIGYFKTTYKVSFADCFVLALAKMENAVVVTSDHHEFDVIKKAGDLAFSWIR